MDEIKHKFRDFLDKHQVSYDLDQTNISIETVLNCQSVRFFPLFAASN